MKVDKVQKEILKAMLTNPGGVKYEFSDDGRVLIAPTLALAYVLDQDTLMVSLKGAQAANFWGLVPDQDLSTVLVPTDEYRHGGTARKYLYQSDPAQQIYFDTNLLKHFENPTLLQQRYSPLTAAAITEPDVKTGVMRLVGLICPVRVKE